MVEEGSVEPNPDGTRPWHALMIEQVLTSRLTWGSSRSPSSPF